MLLANYMNKVCSEVFFDIIKMSTIYDISFSSFLNGIELSFKGPEKYLIPMIDEILTTIINNELTKDNFNLFKKKLYQSY